MGTGLEKQAARLKRIYICVNGILCRPGDSHLWSARAVTWLHTHTEHRAESVRYFCTAIGRAFRQQRRIDHLVRFLKAYDNPEWELHLVGHSNGCDIMVRGLAAAQYPKVKALHLFSGACSADFHRNGLNYALCNDSLSELNVYLAGQDKALKLASHSIGRLLGYGVLGLHGPRNVASVVKGKVNVMKVDDFGHSDWWSDENFVQSMGYLI